MRPRRVLIADELTVNMAYWARSKEALLKKADRIAGRLKLRNPIAQISTHVEWANVEIDNPAIRTEYGSGNQRFVSPSRVRKNVRIPLYFVHYYMYFHDDRIRSAELHIGLSCVTGDVIVAHEMSDPEIRDVQTTRVTREGVAENAARYIYKLYKKGNIFNEWKVIDITLMEIETMIGIQSKGKKRFRGRYARIYRCYYAITFDGRDPPSFIFVDVSGTDGSIDLDRGISRHDPYDGGFRWDRLMKKYETDQR